jgi:hypothetical protein
MMTPNDKNIRRPYMGYQSSLLCSPKTNLFFDNKVTSPLNYPLRISMSPKFKLGKRSQAFIPHFKMQNQCPSFKNKKIFNQNYFSPRSWKNSISLQKELITPEFGDGNVKSVTFKFPTNRLSNISSVNKSVVPMNYFFPGQPKNEEKYQSNHNSFDLESGKKEFIPQFIKSNFKDHKSILPPKESMFNSIIKFLESGRKFQKIFYFSQLNDPFKNVQSILTSLKNNNTFKPEIFSCKFTNFMILLILSTFGIESQYQTEFFGE